MNIINNLLQRAKNPSDTLEVNLQVASSTPKYELQGASNITIAQLHRILSSYTIAGHSVSDLACKGLLYMYNHSPSDDQREFYYQHLLEQPTYEQSVSQDSRWRHGRQKEKRDERRGK